MSGLRVQGFRIEGAFSGMFWFKDLGGFGFHTLYVRSTDVGVLWFAALSLMHSIALNSTYVVAPVPGLQSRGFPVVPSCPFPFLGLGSE